MQKIMFNDKFGLTQVVLEGRKTQTRRAYKLPAESYGGLEIEDNKIITFDISGKEIATSPKYYIGEVVAIAQSYERIYEELWQIDKYEASHYAAISEKAGWHNKMFVKAELMPHRIRITDVRVERLNDISESDIKAEGIDYVNGYSESYFFGFGIKTDKEWIRLGNSPREAYAELIYKVSGKGTWQSNPYVFVYEFELVD